MTEEFKMEEILSQSMDTRPGSIVEGVVVSQTETSLLIDVGLKQEASVPLREFSPPYPETGTSFKVLIVRMSGPEGRPLVSYKQARERENWDQISEKFTKEIPLDAKVMARIKGGLKVDIGLDAFLPASQIEIKTVYNPEEWVGKTIQVVILEMDKSKGSVLVSRKKLLEKDREIKKAETLQTLKVGQIFKGKVTGLANFGAFVDIGGIEGLLHVSDIHWIRVDHPQKMLKVGDEIEVKVIKYDAKTQKISLGRKQLLPHPLDEMKTKYPMGTTVKGKVTGLAAFGAFVELEPGIEGLIHVSEISWTERNPNPKEVFKPGQEIEAQLIGFDREKEKISLSLKRLGGNPWEQCLKLYPRGTQLEGEVTHLAPFGAFIKIPLGIEGLLKSQDLSWTEKSGNVQKSLKVGEKISVVVLEINPKEEKMALGVKQLSTDPFKNLKIGQSVKGQVLHMTDFGLFVKLDSGIDALVRKNELFDRPRNKNFSESNPENTNLEQFKEGAPIEASIIKLNKKDRKVELSVRKYERDQEKELLRKDSSQQGNPTLGEATGWNTDSD